MSIFVKKLLTSFCLIFLSLLLFGAAGSWFSQDTWVMIESIESLTKYQKPVFNKIKFVSTKEFDSWFMQQSHDGIHATQWDDLEIKIDKTKFPFEVTYHQYKNGAEADYRASCYLCHANGPRLIRPHFQSQHAPLPFKERLIIQAMNVRIKSYGKMLTKSNDAIKRKVPLQYLGKMETTPLTVPTCTFCHNANTFWGRGELKRQQYETITHLVATKQMPPWPFKLDKKEQRQLELYLRGF